MDVEKRLAALAEGFAGRLDRTDIENAKDLFAHREWGAGLELLCTQLLEYEVMLTVEERRELTQLASDMGLDLNALGL